LSSTASTNFLLGGGRETGKSLTFVDSRVSQGSPGWEAEALVDAQARRTTDQANGDDARGMVHLATCDRRVRFLIDAYDGLPISAGPPACRSQWDRDGRRPG